MTKKTITLNGEKKVVEFDYQYNNIISETKKKVRRCYGAFVELTQIYEAVYIINGLEHKGIRTYRLSGAGYSESFECNGCKATSHKKLIELLLNK